MTTLTIDDIKKLADLSKLAITEIEQEKYLKDINGILGYVGQIANADISDLNKKEISDFNFHTVVRDDNVRDGKSEEENQKEKEIILKNIPQKSSDNYVKVSKVIQK
jgi:aspartyl/glutamyl-tRNA(Asn/Gln) amidotransferase C subunit